MKLSNCLNKIILFLLGVSSLLHIACSENADNKLNSEPQFIVIELTTSDPVRGADVYFSKMIRKSDFDWKIEKHFLGQTNHFGRFDFPFSISQEDSLYVEKDGYFRTGILIKDAQSYILIYREVDGLTVHDSEVKKLTKVIEIPMKPIGASEY
jgi:hypothetical protein